MLDEEKCKEQKIKNEYVNRIEQLVCHFVSNTDIGRLRFLTNHSGEATREEMRDWILDRFDFAEMIAKQYENKIETEYLYFLQKNI